MKTEEKAAGMEAVEQDHFLKSMFNESYLMSPSLNFTTNLMAVIQKETIGIKAPASSVGKKVTFFIFGLIALINITLIYIIWPYVSVWLPEEGIVRYLLDNMNSVFVDYIIRIFTRTFSFSLIFIIALASFSLFGIDDFIKKRFRAMQHNGFMS